MTISNTIRPGPLRRRCRESASNSATGRLSRSGCHRTTDRSGESRSARGMVIVKTVADDHGAELSASLDLGCPLAPTSADLLVASSFSTFMTAWAPTTVSLCNAPTANSRAIPLALSRANSQQNQGSATRTILHDHSIGKFRIGSRRRCAALFKLALPKAQRSWHFAPKRDNLAAVNVKGKGNAI
jgi:hypothetical protein